MQNSLFPEYNEAVAKNKAPRKVRSGAVDATSRYSTLRRELDNDPDNRNWVEVDTTSGVPNNRKPTYVDLFSGAGGMSVGFRNAGFQKLASVEIDEIASKTIQHNFPESHHFNKPIQELTNEELDAALNGQEVDVVCGGPPCQGFSVAGLRRHDDPRNKLFWEYIRIVQHLRPKYLVMENVPGILTMQDGKVYKEILHQFALAGYPNVSVRILEAAEYGVPQLRTRAIFIGNRMDMPNPYPAKIRTRDTYSTIDETIEDLKHKPFDPTINHHGTTHSKTMEERLAAIPPGGSLYETFRDAWKRQYKGRPSMAIKENHGGVHVHYDLNRVLTAREMARLQTFPDSFFFQGTFKKAYWQIGNAVPCLFAEHIAKGVKKQLLK
jgi:DNA (cytosine-5)-methyltransferase 1